MGIGEREREREGVTEAREREEGTEEREMEGGYKGEGEGCRYRRNRGRRMWV